MRLRPFSGTKRVRSIACIAACRSVGASQRSSLCGSSAPPSFSQRRSLGVLGEICVITLSIGTNHCRSEERRVGKECVRRVDLGGRRYIKKKKTLERKIMRPEANK